MGRIQDFAPQHIANVAWVCVGSPLFTVFWGIAGLEDVSDVVGVCRWDPSLII